MSTTSMNAEGTSFAVHSTREIAISEIRRDGETQCRVSLNEDTIEKYHQLMKNGVEFPPARVWFDGSSYWLSDGFQRISAAERLNRREILVEIRLGCREDAQWDSYNCNATHGLPRTTADARIAVARALVHPYSARLSSAQIARHLGIPEPTFRRWRKALSLPNSNEPVRLASRNGTTYPMRVQAIGRCGAPSPRSKRKSLRELEHELSGMKDKAPKEVRCILNVFSNWAFGAASASDSLKALGAICQRLTVTTGFVGCLNKTN